MTLANYVGSKGQDKKSHGKAEPTTALRIVGKYRIGPRLGVGGEGDTFEAVDETTGGQVALKLFRNASPTVELRVRGEFERLTGLTHPGVARALDVGRDDGRLFLVTQLVAGASIASIAEIADDGLRLGTFTRAARQIADALAYLHGRGIVHGDVSPDNVRIASNDHAILIDLGASGVASTGGAFGTLGFAAPEALVGQVGPLTDLFGLGATLFAAWTGTGPFGGGAASVQRMLAGPAPAVSTVRAGLPEGWNVLIERLLQVDPAQRPSSARAVLLEIARLAPFELGEALDLLAPFPAGDPLAGIVVGRAREQDVLQDALDRLADGASPHAVIAVVGSVGSGRRTLIESALRNLAIAQIGETSPPLIVFRGSLAALATWLQTAPSHEGPNRFLDDDAESERQRRFARIAFDLEARGGVNPICVALQPGVDELAFASFVAGAPASGRSLILTIAEEPLARIGALDLTLDPLAVDDVRLLATRAAGDAPPAPAIVRVAAAAGGHAGTVVVLVRQLIQALRAGDADRFAPERDAALDDLLTASFARLPRSARRLVAAVALGSDVGGEIAAIDAGRAGGWLTGDPGSLRLPSAIHETIVARALGADDLQDTVHQALSVLPPDDPRRGVCLEAAGQPLPAAIAFRAAAHAALAGGGAGPARAATWIAEAARLGPEVLTDEDRLFLADHLALEGRSQAALTALAIATDPVPRFIERRAWILTRSGDLDGARRLLEQAIGDAPPAESSEGIVLLRARLARVLVSMGRYSEAIAAAAPILAQTGTVFLAIESTLLAHAFGGDLAAARRLHADLASRTLPPARAAYLGALVDQLAGDLEPALAGYRDALRQAEASGDIHTQAAISLNIAAVASEAGRYQEALSMQDRAIRDLGRLGETAELGAALFNAGMLLLELGDIAGARQVIGRLRHEMSVRSDTSHATVTYLEGELALREGNGPAALDLFTQTALCPGPATGVRRAADLARVELLAEQQRPGEAETILDTLEKRESTDRLNPKGARALADIRLARARIVLARPFPAIEAVLRLAPEVEADAETAARAGRRPLAWRGALVAARLFYCAENAAAGARALRTAERLLEEIRMSTPRDHHASIADDKDARFLAQLARRHSGEDDGAAMRTVRSDGRLRRLLRINKRLNSELRLPRLLELIMDTVIELTEAERGFILLEDEKGALEVKVARNIDQQSLEAGAFELSRSIARQAAAGGIPIVTIDAAGDPRFREALSVSDLHLRSVLAVPLQIKGRAVGTLYVDNRLRKGAFGDDDVQLLLDFSEQAAIAIENARLLGELRRRERQIEVLNRRLTGELAARKEELSGMKQELRENREALTIRYDYRNIIGRTPRMLDLFRLLDRLTDTALPVVIQGESGTGKELVARALHFNGPRRDQPFVSENCAAIPETLLESALFGAVRGAFTGADHDSRGLFEVADGGTLFLDEVGEMSPGMQGKLLRVLQTGELRRVGSEKVRKVDVRIIAATNRDLGRMVEAGQFRQDLFFRLSVARIGLPPLRERRDDIPAIVEHVLGKISVAASPPGPTSVATTAPKRVDAAAMARLGLYRWPGNVRELENEIMRAAALCADQITVSDLSPHVAGESEAALTTLEDPDSLSLRPRVERLERALLREALSRSGGNQTRAAETLGLSRFGLQKKLRRYQIT